MQTIPKEIHIVGANRGGRTNSRLLLKEKPSFPLEVKLFDPIPGRAENLASLFRKNNIKAFPYQQTAEESIKMPADVRVLAIDDPQSLVRIFDKGSQKLLQFGILLVSANTPFGGIVLGIGGSLTSDAPEEIRSQGRELVIQIDALTGERVSSQRMRRQWLNAIQMEPTREMLHQELVEEAKEFLVGYPRGSRLFIAETFFPIPPHIYDLEVITLKDTHFTDRELVEFAYEKVKKLEPMSGRGIAIGFSYFNEDGEPRLSIIPLRKNGRWVVRDTILFPYPVEYQVSYGSLASPRSGGVFATD